MKFPVIGRLHGTIVAATGGSDRRSNGLRRRSPCVNRLLYYAGNTTVHLLTLHDDPERHNAQRYKRSIADPTA